MENTLDLFFNDSETADMSFQDIGTEMEEQMDYHVQWMEDIRYFEEFLQVPITQNGID